jgi:hypothetical protein
MSFRVLFASLFSATLIAVVLIFWAHVPGPIGMVVAAVVGVGALIGLASIDDNGEKLDAAWRAAAPDLATPAPPVAKFGDDSALASIFAAERRTTEAAETTGSTDATEAAEAPEASKAPEGEASGPSEPSESGPGEASQPAESTPADLAEPARPDDSAQPG